MKIYSLLSDNEHYVGVEVEEGMVNFTRAYAVYTEIVGEAVQDYLCGIEEILWEGNFNRQFFIGVIDVLRKHNLMESFVVKDHSRISAPLCPGKIIALGANYGAHVKEMGTKVPEEPVIFAKYPSTVIGNGDDIIKPEGIGRMDYECEFALIIGRTAKSISATDAMQYVAGYTILNDITARDIQSKCIEQNELWSRSKNFDTFCPIGPCIVFRDSIPEPVEVELEMRVNGEVRQKGNTRDLIFPIPEVIEYITHTLTLYPGDVITTGTPQGVGEIIPGDVVEAFIEPIGTLKNTVIED